MLYKITNERTGEEFCGSLKQISLRTGLSEKTISTYVTLGKKATGVWRIERVYANPKKTTNVPPELWKEWDEVTAPYKKAIARYQRKKVC